jgi:hypothetical protein
VKLIIAGSRNLSPSPADIFFYVQRLEKVLGVTVLEIVSGAARGVDWAGEEFARLYAYPCTKFPADWTKGKGAGFARNLQMAAYADGLLAFWDRESHGTQHMIECMRADHKPFRVVLYKFHDE